MTDLFDAAGAAPAAASTHSGRELSLPGWSGSLDSRTRGARPPHRSGATAPTPRASCSAASRAGPERSSTSAGGRWSAWRATSPSTRTTAISGAPTDEHARAVLRRHGITLNPRHLTLAAIEALTDGQAHADTRRRP